MITNIELIHSVWWVIENAKIVPQWEQKLKRIARLRSAVFSTKIEWSQIDIGEAEQFLDGKDIKARPRDKQELRNYMKVLDYIESKDRWSSISSKDVFAIHALVTYDILEPWLQNTYRKQQNAIYNKTGWIVYIPPEWKDVPTLMDQLLSFVNQKKEISVVIRAAVLHHWFVVIHPFIDGNGRTARALTQLFLYQNWFNTKKYFSLEEYYDSDLKNYYDALFIGNDFYIASKHKIDSTRFIEYFVYGLRKELEWIKKHIETMRDDMMFEEKLEMTWLTNRQIHIVLFIKENNIVAAKDILDAFAISASTLKRELLFLKDKRIIKFVWVGRATRYSIK